MLWRSVVRRIVCASTIALASAVMHAQQVAATLNVGNLPYGAAVDSTNGLLHVLNSGGNSVSTFNLVTRALVHTTLVGSSPEGIAVGPTGLVYVASTFSNAVSIINPANNYSVTSIAVGYHPQAIAVNPVNGKVYVADYGSYPDNKIYIIDPANNNSTTYVYSASAFPWRIAIDATTGTVYVVSSNGASSASTNMTAINPATNGTTSVPVGHLAQAVAVDSNSHQVYVANQSDNNISVITPSSNGYSSFTVQVGSAPVGIALDSTGRVYVANKSASSVSVLDPSQGYSLISTVTVGSGPAVIAYEAGTGKIIVAAQTSKQASIIDTISLTTTNLPVGTLPLAIATSADRGESYVVNEYSNTVTVITD